MYYLVEGIFSDNIFNLFNYYRKHPEFDRIILELQSPGGGMMGALGGMASSLGAGGLGDQLGGLGDLAGLASGFSQLGLSSDRIGKFVPVVLSFVQNQGGDSMKGLLEKVMSPSA